jgi:hypothetical protein
VEGFHAEILRSNVAILTLLKHLGASLNDAGSDDEVHVDLPLPPLPADGDFSRLPDGAGAQLLRFAASELHLLGKRK